MDDNHIDKLLLTMKTALDDLVTIQEKRFIAERQAGRKEVWNKINKECVYFSDCGDKCTYINEPENPYPLCSFETCPLLKGNNNV